MSHISESQVTTPTSVFGQHYLVELGSCSVKKIQYIDTVCSVMDEAVKKSNATVLHTHYHQFEPTGVSGFILIAESHFSIHTWPEHAYASLDIQTCGKNMNSELALEIIVEGLCAQRVEKRVIHRGLS